ncbi:MAG TPA: sigma-54 dependent transcriptional regulator, partial [Pyrinomonadaceae bacterium]|nr:sigma-54 dependent transcriptional regulator [Pyrinomonadaceae bacterium]
SALQSGDFDALLMDLNYTRETTSGREGLDAIPRFLAVDERLPIVVMTAWGSVDIAVEAMRRGARDFVQKPWENERLLNIIRTQVELGEALRKKQRLEEENRLLRAKSLTPLIAESRAMRPVLEVVERVSASDANVLVRGENGTGKDVVAQHIHARSARAAQPLVVVNAGAMPEGLFESELFGHVRGAFTDAKADRAGRFQLADRGTLFLDEIANVPPGQQAKLLRVLETGEFERVGSSKTLRVDVRILSATNADVDEMVAAGRFRQDLLFRLNTIEIHLPPLRERGEDIPLLARHFLAQHARRYRKRIEDFEEGALKALRQHHWPGNVRELNRAVERGVLMAEGARVTAEELGLRGAGGDARRIEEMSLEEVEVFLIKKALARYDGNVVQAARALGLSRSAMYRRLQRNGL